MTAPTQLDALPHVEWGVFVVANGRLRRPELVGPAAVLSIRAAALAVLAAFLQEHPEQTSEAKRALAQKYCDLAWQFRNDKRYDTAMHAYSQAVKVAPDYAPAWYERGVVRYDLLKQYDLAEHDWSKFVELEPKNAVAHYNLGNALRDQHKLDDAISAYRKAIALDAKYAQAHNNLGLCLRAQNKLDDAIAEYRQAIALDPKYTFAHNNLGVALWAQKKPAEAIAAYRHAIAVDPNYAPAYSNLGIALRALGKSEECIAAYRRAIALDPGCVQAHFNLGLALHVQGKLKEAIAEYRQAIALDPKCALPHNNIGNALLAQKKFAEATAEYRHAIALDPKCTEAHNNLAWLLATCPQDNLRDAGQAVALAQKAVGLLPAEGICWRTLGVANYRAGHWKAAQEALDKSMALRRGGDSNDWFFLAMVHWQLGGQGQGPSMVRPGRAMDGEESAQGRRTAQLPCRDGTSAGDWQIGGPANVRSGMVQW